MPKKKLKRPVITISDVGPDWQSRYIANHNKRKPDVDLLIQEWCSYINSTNAEILAKAFKEFFAKYGLSIQEKK